MKYKLKDYINNKNGWGLAEMLFLSSLLLIALLVAVYFIYKLYCNLGI